MLVYSILYLISYISYLLSYIFQQWGGQIIITVIIAVVIPLMITAAVMYVLERLSDRRGAKLSFCKGKIELTAEESRLLKHYKADITLTNLFTGETAVIKGVRFSSQDKAVVQTKLVPAAEGCSCGMLRAVVSAVKWRYGFCPAYVKGVPPKAVSRLIMPQAASGFVPAELLFHSATSSDGIPDGGTCGARTYQRGERMSDIHMKLSAKMGKYMVRERLPEDSLLTFAFFYEKEFAEKNAALLLGCVGECLTRGIKCRVFFGEEQAAVNSYEEIEPLFAQLLSAERQAPAEKAQFGITHGEVVCK